MQVGAMGRADLENAIKTILLKWKKNVYAKSEASIER
jgi:hypothetical protein